MTYASPGRGARSASGVPSAGWRQVVGSGTGPLPMSSTYAPQVRPSPALAYPLSTFTYAIVSTTSPKADALKSFINYAMTAGQKYGPVLDFAPIPEVVLNASNATLNKIHT